MECARDPCLTLVRIKNTFLHQQDTSTDYADVKIILRFTHDGKEEFLEIQLIPELYMLFKKIEHKFYEFNREDFTALLRKAEARKALQQHMQATLAGDDQ